MALTREQYLESCQICLKRSTSMQKGIICSLTNEQAAYSTDDCPDFSLDEATQIKKAKESKEKNRAAITGVVTGALVTLFGLCCVLFFLAHGKIHFYSLAIFITGIVVTIKLSLNMIKTKERNATKTDEII